ncbi:MAG: RNA methyltransferase [Lachnospiraceae bacterium]|nr:RNA methyltransferase [Lachnospiraceae bacterium]
MIIKADINTIAELEVFWKYGEPQLFHYYEPEPGIFIAESPNVIERALNAGYIPEKVLMEERYADGRADALLARLSDIPVYIAGQEIFKSNAGFSAEKLSLTRGMLCVMRRRPLPDAEMVIREARRIAVLEDIVNPTNVGAIFRSAAALGMDAVLLTHDSSDPLYRRAARVSMGTVFQIPWTVLKTGEWPGSGLKLLRENGFCTAAMALKDDSVSIDDACLMKQEKLAVVLGTESEGLKPETIAACDYTVKIPMHHGVDSLNVAAASAVAFWQLGRK